MAKRPANATRVYVNQYDVSGFLNATSLTIEQANAVATCFSDTGPRRIYAGYDHSHSHGGFIDTANDSFDEIAFGLLASATDIYVGRFYEGISTEGNNAYEALVQPTSQPRAAALGEAIAITIDAAGSGHLSRGIILRSATISGTGNSTGINHGATASGTTLVATFRCISGTFTSITMNIQESSDDGGGDAYTTISGMTSGSMTAAGVVRVTTTAATEAYKRVNVSAFSGTSVVVLVTLTVEAETA